jgi:hypothetical protein
MTPWTATIEVTMSATGSQHAESLATEMLDFLVSGFDGVAGAVIKVEVTEESARSLVGYERRLHKMRIDDLFLEAERVGLNLTVAMKAGSRPALVRSILEAQNLLHEEEK